MPCSTKEVLAMATQAELPDPFQPVKVGEPRRYLQIQLQMHLQIYQMYMDVSFMLFDLLLTMVKVSEF